MEVVTRTRGVDVDKLGIDKTSSGEKKSLASPTFSKGMREKKSLQTTPSPIFYFRTIYSSSLCRGLEHGPNGTAWRK